METGDHMWVIQGNLTLILASLNVWFIQRKVSLNGLRGPAISESSEHNCEINQTVTTGSLLKYLVKCQQSMIMDLHGFLKEFKPLEWILNCPFGQARLKFGQPLMSSPVVVHDISHILWLSYLFYVERERSFRKRDPKSDRGRETESSRSVGERTGRTPKHLFNLCMLGDMLYVDSVAPDQTAHSGSFFGHLFCKIGLQWLTSRQCRYLINKHHSGSFFGSMLVRMFACIRRGGIWSSCFKFCRFFFIRQLPV